MSKSRFVVACVLALLTGSALAQGFPSRPITLMCPCPPVIATGQYLATLARIASKYIGQPVVIESPTGANTQVGLERVARSTPPDGYLLSVLPIPFFRTPHLVKVNWHPLKDFTYIIGLAGTTFGVVVKSDSQFKTIIELIEYAKANPGRLSYGGSLRGATAHLVMEELGLKAGARFLHVPADYPESVKALMDGRIMAISDTTTWVPRVEDGTFRLLVTFGEKRSRWNAPTARELGLDVLSYAPFGLVGPKGMDQQVTKLLHDAFNRTLDDPEYDQILRRLDMVDWYKSSEDYAEWAIDQFKFQGDLLKRLMGARRN